MSPVIMIIFVLFTKNIYPSSSSSFFLIINCRLAQLTSDGIEEKENRKKKKTKRTDNYEKFLCNTINHFFFASISFVLCIYMCVSHVEMIRELR